MLGITFIGSYCISRIPRGYQSGTGEVFDPYIGLQSRKLSKSTSTYRQLQLSIWRLPVGFNLPNGVCRHVRHYFWSLPVESNLPDGALRR